MPSNAPAPTVITPNPAGTLPTRPRLLWVLAGLLAAVLIAYGGTRLFSAGQVMGSVTADQTELGGLSPASAAEALVGLEDSLGNTPAEFTVLDRSLLLAPESVGFDLDEEAMVQSAMKVGRSGNPFGEFTWWVTHLFSSTPIPLSASLDPNALELVLATWDTEVIGNPPFPGSVVVEGTEVVGQDPRAGQRIDRNVAPDLILAQASTSDRSSTSLPVNEVAPSLSDSDIEAAVRQGELLLAGPVTLTNRERDKQVTFSVEELAAALLPSVEAEEITFEFDPEVVSSYLEPVRADIEEAPVNAELSVDGDYVTVIPGVRGTVINPAATAAEMMEAASSASRAGPLPIDESVDPEVTTAELEALNIQHKVSQFTTYHDCCQNRVTNIHLIADAVNNTIIEAGQEFSLNEAVGQRTAEDGYLEDGAIIGGRLEKAIGGGVSQFATTFYNAIFWGGYEDIAHKPHSFYFSRYPLGIEATISWPLPDVRFRNNSDSAILVRTFYSRTSITVAFYSENDGRILVGEQSGGELRLFAAAEGGENARRVSADVTEPTNFRDPPPPRYIGDPTIVPPDQKEDQSPARGYTVEVTRFITVGDQTREDQWTVVYSPRQQIILVHPCQIQDSGVSCPTTTTAPPVTTVPAPPPTTVAP
ncbi:MAG TPA: VanW family protein [Acidimicrobiia bacterium]|nr:VanW family protein [Acidimicrobiia bacterium]